ETPGRMIEIVLARTRYSNDNGYRDERGRFRGLHFKNVHSVGGGIILRGHDATHAIDEVTFENCTIVGRPVRAEDLTVNEFVRHVSISSP
ncbi:MAG TPA: hypothetical protein VHN79_12570, partial [Lacunisphaera sp.]|nr:hypothetical protein [Lacunisphaera sp.]